MDDKKRKRLVTNEIKRLTDIFKEVDSKKQRTIKGLIEESASVKTYNTMINRYTAAVKELLRLVIENDRGRQGDPDMDEFMNFLSKRE